MLVNYSLRQLHYTVIYNFNLIPLDRNHLLNVPKPFKTSYKLSHFMKPYWKTNIKIKLP